MIYSINIKILGIDPKFVSSNGDTELNLKINLENFSQKYLLSLTVGFHFKVLN